MSTNATTQQPNLQTAEPQIPDDERLHQLAVEAGKYHGLNVGEPLPVEELYLQAEANGYGRRETKDMLEAESYGSVESIPLPPQGDVLGELWKVCEQTEPTVEAPNAIHQSLESFREWCENKRQMRRQEYDDGEYQHPVEHAYSYKRELQKFVRAKDVERRFIDEYDTFTTVLITYTHPRSEDESVAEHAQRFYPRRIRRKRRECIKATGYWDEYAGVSLLAPKEVAPNPTAQTTHAHDALWIPGFVSSECFDPLQQMESVDVSMQYALSDQVESPSSINRSELEQDRGATTALSQEVGANLPVLTAIESFRDKVEAEVATEVNSAQYKAALDATDCPAYVERWCAHMSGGEDGDPSTNGVQRWRPLGKFNDVADSMKDKREYGSTAIGAEVSGKKSASPDNDGSTDEEGSSHGDSTDTSCSTESRFTFTEYGESESEERVSPRNAPTDESRFTFNKHGES